MNQIHWPISLAVSCLFWLRLNHDATLSEAYALFRKQDSVLRLRLLLRRRWGVTVGASSASKSTDKRDTGGEFLEMGGCHKGGEGNERNPDQALQTRLKTMSNRGNGSKIGETFGWYVVVFLLVIGILNISFGRFRGTIR